MSKSVLYTNNSNAQATTVNAVTLNVGNPVRRYGCNINADGGNIIVNGCGYYAITVNIEFAGSSAGSANVTLYKDGTAIPGATAIVTTAAATNYNIVVPAVFREKCDCDSTISVVISGATGSVTNISASVVKL